jgi:AcrR family transcriptional regulator
MDPAVAPVSGERVGTVSRAALAPEAPEAHVQEADPQQADGPVAEAEVPATGVPDAAVNPEAPEGTAAGTEPATAAVRFSGQDGPPVKEGNMGKPVTPRARSGAGGRPRRPSLGGGIPAQERELGAQGRQTIRRLLEAGLAEFDERGFQAVRVDDVVRRAKTSHGTFYLYFANKEDLFKTLLRDALHDMAIITGEFPVVTRNEAGRGALRDWIRRFCDTYAAHATVIRILSQADSVGEEIWGDGLQLLFRLAEAITQGMTASSRAAGGGPQPSAATGTGQEQGGPEHAELTAVACLMMLERVNYLLSVEVRLPRDEMVDRLSAIIFAAFNTA